VRSERWLARWALRDRSGISEQFKRMDNDWSGITSMLSRMIDRADDFCKYSSDADYRGIVKEDPLTGDGSFFTELGQTAP
jgi:hypothetical protein